MTPARNFDAIVIGAGVNGLVAATYLAKSGLQVLLAEARNKLGGRCETAAISEGFQAPLLAHAFYAFDPQIIEDFKLARRGLVFAVRDMPLVAPRSGGTPIILERDTRATTRSIAALSQADAAAYPEFRRQLFALARKMRPLWWDNGRLELGTADSDLLEKIRRQSVVAWLNAWFETDELKSAIAFDALGFGFSPLDPGSALALLWRASQEMCGLQGALAAPKGGPGALVQALSTAAQEARVEIRTGICVTHIYSGGNGISGIETASGEIVFAPVILSSLPRRRTLLELASDASLGFERIRRMQHGQQSPGFAKILLAVNGLPPAAETSIGRGRMVLTERLEGLVGADEQARLGSLPDELAMEAVIPTLADPALAPPGQHVISVLVWPVPAANAEWTKMKSLLAERVVLAVERALPGFAKHISALKIVSPADTEEMFDSRDEGNGLSAADWITAPWDERIKTSVEGLYLCGAGAEPAGAISGRAARIAAAIALAERKP